ncbi:MAG TPA: GMC family oxidoreductase [Thermomicrobiales bacterium]|nr:GMC family oxidoreductase [Thermomicrobiales bacterium]
MSNPLPKVDVLMIGIGAAGGVASYVLTKAGISVVALEAGPRNDEAIFLSHYDELDGYPFHNPFADVKGNKEIPTWRPDAKSPVQAPPAPPIVMDNQVGGTSVHWSAQSWRYREDDFKIRSTTIDKYGETALPEGSAVVDWPITYDDLEPYYEQVENLIGISGQGGSNPFESPRKNDYPMPPLRRSGVTELADTAMANVGFHPFPQPASVLSQDYNGRSACSFCGYCTGHGCWNDAKGSTLVTAIPEAEKTGKLEIRTNSRVTKILSNDKGQVTGVTYLDDKGQEQEQPAGVVILSTYVYENSRLLLVSTSDYYKNGLGNNAGNVGKYYMAHSYGGPSGYIPGKNFNLLSGTVSQATAMDDMNGDNFDHTDLGFIRGAISFVGPSESTPIAQSGKLPPNVPAWGSEYKKFIHDGANSVSAVFTQLEVLPYEGNFLDLDPTAKDEIGMPIVRVTFSLGENEQKANTYINKQLEPVLKEMGATQIWSPQEPATIPINSHAYGGTRMGDDPSMSVVDMHGISHEASNLMILGGSNWCSTTGYNPTETIEAHAWFAADYLAKNLDKIAI